MYKRDITKKLKYIFMTSSILKSLNIYVYVYVYVYVCFFVWYDCLFVYSSPPATKMRLQTYIRPKLLQLKHANNCVVFI